MALDLWGPFKRRPCPQHLPGVAVEADNLPGVLARVANGGNVSVVADADLWVRLTTADSGRHEYAVAPDDGARVAKARNGGFPADRLIRLYIPSDRWMLPLR